MAGGGGAGAGSSSGGGGGGGREGDWDCGSCGNRNYAFRSLCNRCKQPRLLVDPNTPRDSKWLPRAGDWICTALGTKRLASEDLANDWDNKRLNPGNDNYPLSTGAANNLFLGIEQGAGSSNGQSAFPKFDNGSSMALPSGQGMSGLMGKGAKWRDGDWLCNNCNNHNYASRAFCNRCKTQKESAVHPGVL
uniref:Zn-finger, RanBP-type, containing protein n=1 Tax=Zea mays TaxID=4577 RepID=B6U4G4_MAIZE|nr:Zn-finger, RanBP-type, containing protein [Zea mays]|eukprot:NP_001151762.1 uncharacterized protein LOC100285397 [Zea mays]